MWSCISDLLWILTLCTVVDDSILLDWLCRVGPVKLHFSGAQLRKAQVSRTGVWEGWVCCGAGLHSWRHNNTKESTIYSQGFVFMSVWAHVSDELAWKDNRKIVRRMSYVLRCHAPLFSHRGCGPVVPPVCWAGGSHWHCTHWDPPAPTPLVSTRLHQHFLHLSNTKLECGSTQLVQKRVWSLEHDTSDNLTKKKV